MIVYAKYIICCKSINKNSIILLNLHLKLCSKVKNNIKNKGQNSVCIINNHLTCAGVKRPKAA